MRFECNCNSFYAWPFEECYTIRHLMVAFSVVICYCSISRGRFHVFASVFRSANSTLEVFNLQREKNQNWFLHKYNRTKDTLFFQPLKSLSFSWIIINKRFPLARTRTKLFVVVTNSDWMAFVLCLIAFFSLSSAFTFASFLFVSIYFSQNYDTIEKTRRWLFRLRPLSINSTAMQTLLAMKQTPKMRYGYYKLMDFIFEWTQRTCPVLWQSPLYVQHMV